MKRKQFSEEQIIGILKEAEAGAVVTELCRKHGMSSATYYAWKAKYGGLEVSEAKRLRALEDENGRLKRLLADKAAIFTDGRYTLQVREQVDGKLWDYVGVPATSPADSSPRCGVSSGGCVSRGPTSPRSR